MSGNKGLKKETKNKPTAAELQNQLSELRKQELELGINEINEIIKKRNLIIVPALNGQALNMTIQGQPITVVVLAK